jgi:hypothetical protein
MKQRTTAYVMTIDPNSVSDWDRVQTIRSAMRAINYSALQVEQYRPDTPKTRFRVTLKGRLGEKNPAYKEKYKGRYHYHIAMEDASRVDVYIHKRIEY